MAAALPPAAQPAATVAPAGSVLGDCIPSINYKACTGVPSTPTYDTHPAAVRVWDVDDAILAQKVPACSIPKPTQLITTVWSSEVGVENHVSTVLFETLNQAIKVSEFRHTGAQWVLRPASKLLDRRTAAAASVSASGKPDGVLKVDGRVVACIETKRIEVLEPVGLNSLAKPWNDGVQQGQFNNSIAVISQVTGYASSGGLRVAAITTYRRTWVLQFNVAGRNTVEVSKAYAWDAQKPSALQALWHITVLALTQSGPASPWTPLPVPPGFPSPPTPARRTRSAAAGGSSGGSGDGSGPQGAPPRLPHGGLGAADTDSGGNGPTASTASLGADWGLREVEGAEFIGSGMTGDVVGGSVRGVRVAVKKADDPHLIAALQSEAEFLEQLGDLQPPVTPKLLRHDWTTCGNAYWLATELLEGHTLDLVAHPEDAALLPAASEGLARIHSAGVLHGDIRPENLLVVPGGPGAQPRVVWLDFGLACHCTDAAAHQFEQRQLQLMFTAPASTLRAGSTCAETTHSTSTSTMACATPLAHVGKGAVPVRVVQPALRPLGPPVGLHRACITPRGRPTHQRRVCVCPAPQYAGQAAMLKRHRMVL
eukprot:CAMPEP_0202868670 /NCGR_PEP_ID=MMETSP1391-20130828/11007_1 /ASSEMBLY_ACC=CAM_ASM_000867 /TAXON_ID=1034604 /ORGANISM="Chlamydomonas leiostraca, Strain SAG 11-49" /LENGTH=595 /DNA_ID=CAMNT_0049548865 /DNA_START=6 /DNA_END=1793 /DNA_ORIENTATION=+